MDFENIDLNNPLNIIAIIASFFLIIVGRYFIIAGVFDWYFNIFKKKFWLARKINKKARNKKQFFSEIKWSMLTALIFAIIGTITVIIWQKGYTKIYSNLFDYSLLWWPISLIIAMVIHETYYYWLHRLMHHPSIYKKVHKIHHDSLITSPWTAFSFHPIEGFFEALIMPAIIIFLPMHYTTIVVHLTIMTLTAAINHLDIEIYPKNKFGNYIGRRMIGATHHAHHHQYFKFNFGLYFTFWDSWAKTESPKFKKEFEERN